MYTIIIKMPDGNYTVRTVKNIQNFVLEDNKYTLQKRNKGKRELVFSIKGDYYRIIKRCGVKPFINLLKSYDPLADEVRKIMY